MDDCAFILCTFCEPPLAQHAWGSQTLYWKICRLLFLLTAVRTTLTTPRLTRTTVAWEMWFDHTMFCWHVFGGERKVAAVRLHMFEVFCMFFLHPTSIHAMHILSAPCKAFQPPCSTRVFRDRAWVFQQITKKIQTFRNRAKPCQRIHKPYIFVPTRAGGCSIFAHFGASTFYIFPV